MYYYKGATVPHLMYVCIVAACRESPVARSIAFEVGRALQKFRVVRSLALGLTSCYSLSLPTTLFN